MEIFPNREINKIKFPLSIYGNVKIAEALSKNGEQFDIFAGLNEKDVKKLKKLSLNENDIDLQKNTGDRARFGEGSYEAWYQKNRTPFCLIHRKSGALAALVWFGPESLFPDKKKWHTVGWRSYLPFRGKGIMKDFTHFVLGIYKKNFPDAIIWAKLKKENADSARLATGLGFHALAEASDDASLVMVK